MSTKQLGENELREIARQLRQPEGEGGIRTAEQMQQNNAGMIRSAIDLLAVQPNESILEIGPGNGSHLNYLLEKAPGIRYTGVDISATMIAEANRLNEQEVANGNARFIHSGDPRSIPFPTTSADGIFTVNTLYFWDNPGLYLLELYRCLKPQGRFSLCFAPASFMKKLPFTVYDFKTYEQEEVVNLLTEAGFVIQDIYERNEEVYSGGEMIPRDYLVILSVKQ